MMHVPLIGQKTQPLGLYDRIAVFFALLLGILVSSGAYTIAGAIMGIVVLVLAFPYPRSTLYLLVIWTFLQNLPRSYLPEALQGIDLLDEVLLIVLTLRWVLPIVMGKRSFQRTPIDVPVMAFIGFYVLSVIWNKVPPLSAIFAFRDVFQYLLLFYALVNIGFSTVFLKKCVRLIYVIALANFVVLILQLLLFYYQTGTIFIQDWGVGLMGISGAHKLGYFAGMLFIAQIARVLAGYKLNKSWFIILVIIIVLTSTRAVLFWVPLSLLVLFGPGILFRPRQAIRTFAIIAGFAGVVFLYVSLPITQSATINPRSLYIQQMGTGEEGGSMQRITFLHYSWQTLKDHNPIIGTGPGTYVSKTPSIIGSRLFTKFREDFPFKNSMNMGSQISLTIVEYGLLGSLIILWVYWRMYRVAGHWAATAVDPVLRGLAFGTKGMIIMIMFSLVSNNIFELQVVMFIPWFFSGMLIAMTRSSSHTRKNMRANV